MAIMIWVAGEGGFAAVAVGGVYAANSRFPPHSGQPGSSGLSHPIAGFKVMLPLPAAALSPDPSPFERLDHDDISNGRFSYSQKDDTGVVQVIVSRGLRDAQRPMLFGSRLLAV